MRESSFFSLSYVAEKKKAEVLKHLLENLTTHVNPSK